MKKLIIFDLDGTLIDTLEDLKNSVNYALNLHSFPLKSKEDIRKAIGNGVAKLVARSMPDNENNPEYQNTFADFRKHYSKNSCVYTIPYDGVKEVLINLKSLKIEIFMRELLIPKSILEKLKFLRREF